MRSIGRNIAPHRRRSSRWKRDRNCGRHDSGSATSIRVEGTSDAAAFSEKLRAAIDPEQIGMAVFAAARAGTAIGAGLDRFRRIFHVLQFLSGGVRAAAGGVVLPTGDRAAAARDRHAARGGISGGAHPAAVRRGRIRAFAGGRHRGHHRRGGVCGVPFIRIENVVARRGGDGTC